MKPKVYLETSIVSYVAVCSSRDLYGFPTICTPLELMRENNVE